MHVIGCLLVSRQQLQPTCQGISRPRSVLVLQCIHIMLWLLLVLVLLVLLVLLLRMMLLLLLLLSTSAYRVQ